MKKAALFVLALSTNVSANAADLLDVYRQARANDPAWVAAQAEHRAAQEQVPQARAGLLPSVGFSADAFRNNRHVDAPPPESTQKFTNKGYTLELNQPLYNRSRSTQYDQAISGATQADFELVLAQQDLILRTALAYLSVLNAREALEFARSEKAAVERVLALARRNFSVGAASLIDVHDAQAAYDLATSQEITAENNLETSRQALRTLTGQAVDELAVLTGELNLQPPEPNDMEKWVASALAQSPSVKAREQIAEQARLEVARSRAGHYPTLDAVASHNWDEGVTNSGAASESTTNLFGLRLQIPLYGGGGVTARVRETLALQDAALQQLEATRRDTSQRARAAYLAVINGIAQVRALDQARASNRRALESTVLGQERGLRTGLDVLNNQRTLYRTLRDLANARYNYLQSRLELDAVAGMLNEDDLQEINRLLRAR